LDTFDNIRRWLEEVEQYSQDGGSNVMKLLVANKVDKTHAISREEGYKYALSHGLTFVENSAKNGEGIIPTFNHMIQQVVLFFSLSLFYYDWNIL